MMLINICVSVTPDMQPTAIKEESYLEQNNQFPGGNSIRVNTK